MLGAVRVMFESVPDTIVIRPAHASDVPDLQRVYRESSLSNIGDRDVLLEHPEHLLFSGLGVAAGRTTVALVDDHLVGFASIADGGPMQLELEDLFVDPAWQRRGIARHLIADVARIARRNAVRTLVVTGNPHARAFYLTVGFVQDGEVITEFGPAPRFRMDLT